MGTPKKIPRYKTIVAHLDFVEAMLREADVVTVATPVLAHHYAMYPKRPPVVVRNACDMSLYEATEERTDVRPTAVFYGTQARLRDLFGGYDNDNHFFGGTAWQAVRENGLRAIWIGDEGTAPIPAEFAQIVPFKRDLRDFARTLANTHADVGLAPLMGDEFDKCKSELHWLDYSAAGIPVVAERLMGPNPYSPIRSGVDGFLARGRREWVLATKRIVREPNLGADLVAAARERLATEYDPRKRALEWAEVFQMARAGA